MPLLPDTIVFYNEVCQKNSTSDHKHFCYSKRFDTMVIYFTVCCYKYRSFNTRQHFSFLYFPRCVWTVRWKSDFKPQIDEWFWVLCEFFLFRLLIWKRIWVGCAKIFFSLSARFENAKCDSGKCFVLSVQWLPLSRLHYNVFIRFLF